MAKIFEVVVELVVERSFIVRTPSKEALDLFFKDKDYAVGAITECLGRGSEEQYLEKVTITMLLKSTDVDFSIDSNGDPCK
jgi:hypothetical protein